MINEEAPPYDSTVPNLTKRSDTSLKMEFSEGNQTPLTLSWY
jgi:hypothetical protein